MSDTAAVSKTAAVACPVCPRRCFLAEGQPGFCRARVARGGEVVAQNYGRITSLALDPIEKKPLARFHPGGRVLSAGSYGCNLRCPFCQNHAISQRGEGEAPWQTIAPKALARRAAALRNEGNIGLAFTYNEPAVGWEYVRDATIESKKLGLVNVMVTNGCFSGEVMEALLPGIDAFNIDLKCFSEAGYQSLGGSLAAVKANIAAAARAAHVEVTTLAVPGLAGDEAGMEREAAWLAGLNPEIPLHISRYFPSWRAEAPPTPLPVMHRLAAIARRHLKYVYLGNC